MTDAPGPSRHKTKSTGQGANPKPGPQPAHAGGDGPQSVPQTGQPGTGKEATAQGQQPEQQQQQQPRQFAAEVAQRCIDLVELYRRGGKTRGEILLLLARELKLQGTDEDDPAASAAFDTYCAQVNEIDLTRKEKDSGTDSQGPQPEHGAEDNDDTRGRSQTLRQSNGKKRTGRERDVSRSHSSRRSDSRSLSPLDLSDDEHGSSKRQKPDPTKFAWAQNSKDAEKKLRPEVLQTLTLLRSYAVDVRFAKSNLINSVGAPEFPDAEWGNVLRGKPVDLNHVFSGQYTLGQDEKHVEKLGPVELSYRAVTPAKVVKSAGDWVIAWQRATAAIVYAFPHRKQELEDYHNHIFGFFGAIHPDYHHRILDYDRAVRKRVGAMRTLLLSDTHEFANLRTLHIDSIGASAATGYPSKRREGGAKRTPSDEACKRWNRGTCNTAADACKLVDVSLYHAPLPDVPQSILNDPVINQTLSRRPDLFKIVTPIKIDIFESFLHDHPNPAFVHSVVKGLREGFWPFADGRPLEYPETWDETRPPLLDERAQQFLRDQRDEEIALDRYSHTFGTDLLPGMYSMPIHVVPKPHSNKLRLINNLSAGKYSLNGMIRPESIKGAVLDGLPALGAAFRKLRRDHPSEDLILWKSDVSQAYRRMPMSPYWQIFQVVTVDGKRHIDHCNTFGGRASLRIWLAFYCLVAWIAVNKRGVSMLVNYVDDSAGIQLRKLVEWYFRYGMYIPRDQARLLRLWDDLGLAHDLPKQEHDLQLTWIGFMIDVQTSYATLPNDARLKLLAALEHFCGPSRGRRRTLAEFQSLAGYVNWALNVFPLLRPALSNLYHKIADKHERYATIHVNNAVRSELTWMADHIRTLPGICILSQSAWSPADLIPNSMQDEFAMVDASSIGLGLYFPWHHFGFFAPAPKNIPTNGIFFPEALAICSAIHKLTIWRSIGRHITRIAILSDNTNAVGIFRSLRAEPVYNRILMSSIDVLISNGTEHRVHHIPGKYNVTADALSRGRFDLARLQDPALRIFSFSPPLDAFPPPAR
uniref:Argininosuccinate lyase (ASAL) ) n=1 Tax=Ganoderma boninense TaxID=34458 RepID=A0A5K1K3V4_9APHY|nr:Argininosuccinate lyase (ASAL) (EC (Arginosuccinase) [Ganoderma boninense]